MKKILYLILLITSICFSQSDMMLIASQQQFANETGGGMIYDAGNLILFPEDLSNAAWLKGNLNTYQYDTYLSPFGDLTSDRVNCWSTSAGYFRQSITVTASTDYTFSWYAKPVTRTDMQWQVTNSGGTDIVAITSYFADCTVGAWTLITKTFNSGANTSIRVFPFVNNNSTGTFEIWGIQLYPTP